MILNACMDREGLAKMVRGLIPNGLIPEKAETIDKILDHDRWSRAEDRASELLTYIQPTFKSDQRRNEVVSYLRHLINSTVPCQLFPLGSVPLKTYLPDGDIDLTTFGYNKKLDNDLVNEVLKVLESEQNSDQEIEFRVKEVQYIQAEVKILKCLVENFVIDISFNQISGLCTLCFLEEVDNIIGQNHLFKRSVLLIKAWCYYESRILGAQHGLMSTYALETLVIYIFVVYNGAFVGPLEVLYRFLEFFSKFDWNNYCISVRGPVPINSLPNMTVERPRKDCPELVLNDKFFDACVYCYDAKSSNPENQDQPFVTKYINIIDPLQENNNLGRSISKGNFFRIRSAFSFGAQRLMRLMDCPTEKLIAEIDFFFKNTWDRHGKGFWIPFYDLRARTIGSQKPTQYGTDKEDQQPQEVHQNCGTNLSESKDMVGTSNVSIVFEAESSKTININTSTMTSDDIQQKNAMESATTNQGHCPKHSPDEVTDSMKNELMDQGQSSEHSSIEVDVVPHFADVYTGTSTMASDMQQPDPMKNLDDQGQTVPAMAHSAKEESIQELTPTSNKHMDTPVSGGESEQIHATSSVADHIRGSSLGHEVSDNQNTIALLERNKQSFGMTSYGQRSYGGVHLSGASNHYYGEFGRGVNNQNFYLLNKEMHMQVQMHQEQYAFMNIMDTLRNLGFNGYPQTPMNVNAPHYFDPYWGQSMPYAQDFVPFSEMDGFPGVRMPPICDRFTNLYGHNTGAAHLDCENSDGIFWLEQYMMNNRRVQNSEDGNMNLQPQQEISNMQMIATGISPIDTCIVPASGPIENQCLFSNEFGPSGPLFPFPLMLPFLSEGIDVLESDYPSNYANMRYGLFCLHGKPYGPRVPSPFCAPLMNLQLLLQFRWQIPHTILPSDNINNMPLSFPIDPMMMPIGPPCFVAHHVATTHQQLLGHAFELPRNKSIGIGTYMPDPETYKLRFKSHVKERNFRTKTWRINCDYDMSNDNDSDESEGNLSPRYNSNERFSNNGQFSRRNDPSPQHFRHHNEQWIPHTNGSPFNGTSEPGEGSHRVSNESTSRLQRDSAGLSNWPSLSSNNRKN